MLALPALLHAQVASERAPVLQRMVRSIEWSGFADLSGAMHAVAAERYAIAALELDATGELGPLLQHAWAIVRDGNRAAIGAGFLDLHMGGARIAPRGAIYAERGIHLQAGRFDLPFGGDYAWLAPTDRGLASAPLGTELLNDGGLNDLGARLFVVRARWNATVWAVQGAAGGRALGARYGVTPFTNPFRLDRADAVERPLELGFSAHADVRDGIPVDRRAAVDAHVETGAFTVVTEWIRREVGTPGLGGVARADAWQAGVDVPVLQGERITVRGLGRLEGLDGAALWDDTFVGGAHGKRGVLGLRVDLGEHLMLKSEVARPVGRSTFDVAPPHAWTVNMVLAW